VHVPQVSVLLLFGSHGYKFITDNGKDAQNGESPSAALENSKLEIKQIDNNVMVAINFICFFGQKKKS